MATEARGEEAVTSAALIGRSTRVYVQARSAFLVKSEARVVEALLAYEGELEQLSVAELADEASTSTATVVRAAQSLGFKGYSELRDQLAREADASDKPEVEAESSTLSALDSTLQAGIDQINNMSAMLDRASFERAVEALTHARRVLIATMSDLGLPRPVRRSALRDGRPVGGGPAGCRHRPRGRQPAGAGRCADRDRGTAARTP